MWGGIKAFMAFADAFYPAYLGFPDSDTKTGQRMYYDAAYGQDTASNILGLFAVGEQAQRYQNVSNEDLIRQILDELDPIFDGVPSRSFQRSIVTTGAASRIFRRLTWLMASSSIAREMSRPVTPRLYFAGDSCDSTDDWGGVHNAARSARQVIDAIAPVAHGR